MKHWLTLILINLAFATASIGAATETQKPLDFLLGADVSFLPQMEKLGTVYSDKDKPKDLLQLMKDHGMNTVRLRVWHTPKDGHCGKEETLAMAKRVHNAKMKLLLDFHYSDYWADPGKQPKPAAWEKLSVPDLELAVRNYTKEIMAALVAQGTVPDMVQIGNEITNGMLWEDGHVGKYNDDLHWEQFARMLKAGLAGVQDACGSNSKIQTMIHLDCGGDNGKSRWVLDNLKKRGVEFDLIGLSYYPWWHGTMDKLGGNMTDLASRYDKNVIVVETAHPWFLNKPVAERKSGEFKSHPGYEASTDGQRLFLKDLIALVRKVPGDRGKGVVYWAPEWIQRKGAGSGWGEVTLFDKEGIALPGLDAFTVEY